MKPKQCVKTTDSNILTYLKPHKHDNHVGLNVVQVFAIVYRYYLLRVFNVDLVDYATCYWVHFKP